MKKSIILFYVLLCTSIAFGQVTINRDSEIEKMVNEISADSLKKYDEKLVSFGTRHTLSSQTDPNRGIGAARNYVLKKFKQFGQDSDGRLKAYIDKTTLKAGMDRIDRDVTLGNVMAELKGTDPNDDRIFIVSGHLDSRRTDVMDSIGDAPGANDDLSGVVGVMEMARIMSKHKFPATMIFVAVSGEEQGLFGSQYLADRAEKEDWNVVAMINNDMIGGNDSNLTNIVDNTRVRVYSEGIPLKRNDEDVERIVKLGLENDSPSRQLARYTKEVGERYIDNLQIDLEYRTDRFFRGGDHLPFMNNGFTAIRLVERYENYNHQHQDVRIENGIQYGDLVEFVDFEYVRKNTGVNLSVFSNLLKAPGVPLNVTTKMRGLNNHTTLAWDAPKYHEAKGYYVLMRPTNSPVWTRKYYTSNQEITLPYLLDNYIFGVQSVSENGNESLIVIPSPSFSR